MTGEEKKNIVVCGYPKSGTMWCTRLVAELMDCPAVGYWGLDLPNVVTEGLSRESSYACYQAHQLYQDLNNSNTAAIHKLIYIVRDPRDVLISGFFHFRFNRPNVLRLINNGPFPNGIKAYLKSLDYRSLSRSYKFKRMKAMLTNGDRQIPHCDSGWNEHVKSYLKREDLLVIKYEELLEQGVATCKKMLAHFEIHDKSDQEILGAIEKQSFERRKAEFKKENEKVKYRHMRKGRSGDWKNELSKAEVTELEAMLKEGAKPFGYF